MTTSTRSPRIIQPPTSRFGVAIGVGLGVFASALMGALWLVFGLAAAAGDSGSFVPISVGVFALYFVATIWLFAARRKTAALILAWIPAALPIVLSQLGAAFQIARTGLSGQLVQRNAAPSTNVTLEVLTQKTYDPEWIIEEDPHANVSKWSTLSWDKSRDDRCRTLLTTEVATAPQRQAWFLFVNDTTRRKKAPYTGSAICDPDAIWFEDYASERDRLVLTKFTTQGDFLYRISFQNPRAPNGYADSIMMPTFNARDGYLYFELWNAHQSGRNFHVARSMQVRVKEPQVSSPANSAASAQEEK